MSAGCSHFGCIGSGPASLYDALPKVYLNGTMSAVFAYVTTKDREEARRIGLALVEARLAACVNILDGMESIYRWEGKVEEARETVLLVKTDSSRADAVTAKVKALHSYTTPCVAIWPLTGGNAEYLAWIKEESTGA